MMSATRARCGALRAAICTINQGPGPFMTILETRSITKSYLIGNREIKVLDSISLAVAKGEFLVVKGESGSGKSTLLTILSGLDRPDGGRVLIEGEDITDLNEDALAPLRNATFGFVFQSFHLVPSLTARENVMFPAELKGDPAARAKAEALLGRVGLSERMSSFPHQLSGGEKQRCAICRALINDPRIIFADEPTGNLDSVNGAAVLELLLELQRERNTTLLMVTHSPEIAKRADRVVTLKDGRMVSEGSRG
jgi:putative ABC transport system ATP-binding protein